MIYILGLGSGSEKQLTLETIEILKDTSRELYLRTEIHPAVSYLKNNNIKYKSFDYLYEKSESFEDIYSDAVEKIINEAKNSEITYVVPGNPVVAEKSVFLLLKRSKEENIKTKVFAALSSLESIYSAIEVDPLNGLLVMNAADLNPSRLNRNISTLLVQVYAQHIASETKLALMELYPDTYPIIVIKAAGIEGEERIEEIPLYQLDRLKWIDHLTSVFIKPNQFPLPDDEIEISGNTQIERLINIVSYLRSPDGCPWDKEQTPESIKKHIIEEAYEVVEAIETGDKELLKEELGDLLLQVALQAQMASETNIFDFEEVAESISDKLWRRHPHVFGKNLNLTDGNEVKNLWEKLKNDEKDKKKEDSYLSGIPRALPSLLRAEKVQRKASSVGFDWESIGGVFDKLWEEQNELKVAHNKGNKEEIMDELGDMFFSLINFSRWSKIDPEEALTRSIEKFIKRFQIVEKNIKEQNKKFSDFKIDELESMWQSAKSHN
jgi:tetrapyrrole methylase family protein/MazG family protein